jgi:hypothetical protein
MPPTGGIERVEVEIEKSEHMPQRPEIIAFLQLCSIVNRTVVILVKNLPCD